MEGHIATVKGPNIKKLSRAGMPCHPRPEWKACSTVNRRENAARMKHRLKNAYSCPHSAL
jgi:hypothetical protein